MIKLGLKQQPGELVPELPEANFSWVSRPLDPVPLKDIDEITERANQYFTQCAEEGKQPRLTGIALALGVSGPLTFQRYAMRRPELRWIVSRCLTAVAHGYEENITSGSAAGAIFMLKHIPEFDTSEPHGSRPIQYFNDRKEVQVNARVVGAKTIDEEGAELTPREAYLKVIHGHCEDAVYEDVTEEEKSSVETLMDLLEDAK